MRPSMKVAQGSSYEFVDKYFWQKLEKAGGGTRPTARGFEPKFQLFRSIVLPHVTAVAHTDYAMGGPEEAAGRIFISYRREDTAYPAGWLFDRLTDHFDTGQVFKDVDSIELGDDFVEAISTAVGSCDVLLALIGDQWLTAGDDRGRRRLDDPEDFVRVEIEAALSRDVRVIPILVDGATMPSSDEVPPSLAGLVRRQALELSPSRFDFDSGRLLKVLDKTLGEIRTSQGATSAVVDPVIAAATSTEAQTVRTVAVPPQAEDTGAPISPGPSSSNEGERVGAPRSRKLPLRGVVAGIIALVLVIAAVAVLGGGTDDPSTDDSSRASSRQSSVVFEDDFSDRSSRWMEDGAESALADIIEGRYRIQVEAGRGTEFAWLSPEASDALYPTTSADLSIQVDVQRVAGGSNPSDSYGIFCRSVYGGDDYRFDVERHNATIFKSQSGTLTELESETIPAGIDVEDSNAIRASCRTIEQGGAVLLELAMNGEVVADATDRDSPLLAGTVGLYAYAFSTLDVAFDSVVINEL